MGKDTSRNNFHKQIHTPIGTRWQKTFFSIISSFVNTTLTYHHCICSRHRATLPPCHCSKYIDWILSFLFTGPIHLFTIYWSTTAMYLFIAYATLLPFTMQRLNIVVMFTVSILPTVSACTHMHMCWHIYRKMYRDISYVYERNQLGNLAIVW